DGEVFQFEPVIEEPCTTFSQPDLVTVGFRALPGTTATLAPADGGTVLVQDGELRDASDYQVYDPSRYVLTLKSGQRIVLGDRTDAQPGIHSIQTS
ncbi:MAG: hypothetical protein ACREMV_14250, partial [Gemmatimonadales bacterium]